jgi:hypothetical protein
LRDINGVRRDAFSTGYLYFSVEIKLFQQVTFIFQSKLNLFAVTLNLFALTSQLLDLSLEEKGPGKKDQAAAIACEGYKRITT